ncbi:MAG: MauE/DoxX family redox-associated membrane protein [Gaiellaceae bacterium]
MVLETSSLLLAVILISAGASKLIHLRSFVAQAVDFVDARSALLPLGARALPAVEIVAGALLALGRLVSIVSGIVLLLFAAFAALTAANLSRGRKVPCACFGVRRSRPIGRSMLVRNLLLVGVAALTLSLGLALDSRHGVALGSAIWDRGYLASLVIASAVIATYAACGEALRLRETLMHGQVVAK